jgi:hypothetical protein
VRRASGSGRLQPASRRRRFVFVSERGSPFATAGLARMIDRAAAGADLEIKAHPHMLRQRGPRHEGDPGLAWPSVYHQHCGLHGAGAEQVRGLLWQSSGTEAEGRLVLARPVAPPGKSPRAPRSSVLLTRLYAPSGDVAEPAYAARTSHWAASMKRETGLRGCIKRLGIAGTTF